MAFDTQTRNALARLTADARNLLVEEFTKQMQGVYGIQPTGQISDIDTLGHLDDEQRAVAGVLRDRIHHLIAGIKQDKKALAEAVDRVIREQAFTILNRFAALRMCEERGIVQQCVGNGVLSKGFQVYLQTAGSGLGEQYERYRTYLFCIFDEIAVDLGILFDRYSTYGMLFPREPALFALLDILNRKDLVHVWVEDEAIGWIYQYFNSKEERQQMRKASAAPRNSRELAVRNQFFTPRYVVEFLSDNTLGRIWYEMRKGDTALRDQCLYMVRRPKEIFLAEGEEPPSKDTADKDQEYSQEELLKQPVHIPHRPLKDPRQIRMLDPACGSMHFGLYCFDLFETIYSEAWDIAKSGSLPEGADESFADFCQLTAKYATKADFMRDVPAMIIEHNIHGIDIDPRCAQIAGLSLWLRAQKAWKLQGIKPADRPRITKSNIVCAEPMPGDKELLKEFTSTLNPPLLGQIVERVWDAMQLAGEAGSLLKIEEQIADWVADAKTQWKAMPKASQMLLFEPPAVYGSEPSQSELKLDLTGISDEAFWEQAEERIYAALEDYSNQAAGDGNVAQRLFADDAARGFAFIDITRKRYDAVMMNPPFGEGALNSKKYVDNQYGDARYDVLTCFIERGLNALSSGGALGLIGNRTPFFLPMLAGWRTRSIIEQSGVTTFVDLGHGVLDNAMVEVCATTLTRPRTSSPTPFYKIVSAIDKRAALEGMLAPNRNAKEIDGSFFLKATTDFLLIPKSPFSYWIPEGLLRLFKRPTNFDMHFEAWVGLQTNDDRRWLRLRWETPQSLLNDRWYPFAKGGEYSEFVSNIHLVVDWEHDGKRIKGWKKSELELGRITANNSQCWNETKYLRKGITWTQRTTRRFSARILPEKCIFGIKGPSAFSLMNSEVELLAVLGVFETDIYKTLLEFQVAAADAAAKSYDAGLVRRTPFPKLPEHNVVELANLARSCVQETMRALGYDETSAYFLIAGTPPLNNIEEHKEKLSTLVKTLYDLEVFDLATIADIAESSDSEDVEFAPTSAVAQISYALGCPFGRWDIRYATGERQPPELPDPFDPLPVCPPGMLQNAEGLPPEPKDVPADYPLRISWPGILTDDENHQEDIVARVEDALKVIWKDNWESIEQEACEILGLKTLRDYFAEKKSGSKFFADHLSRYSKSRRQAPIYWPLSTESGSYTLWIYYHRLDDQMLFKCVTDYLEPKIRTVSADTERLQKSLTDGGAASDRDELDKLLDFRIELDSMKAELLRIAHLPYKPDLNDGVIINAAPLWKLFRLKKWQKACQDCWENLESGDYDWAHMAYNIWPDRVREKCRTDKSLAIAHDLEDVYEQPPEKPKKSKGKRKSEPEPEAELNYDD